MKRLSKSKEEAQKFIAEKAMQRAVLEAIEDGRSMVESVEEVVEALKIAGLVVPYMETGDEE